MARLPTGSPDWGDGCSSMTDDSWDDLAARLDDRYWEELLALDLALGLVVW